MLSDTIELKDVIVNQGSYLGHDLDLAYLSQLAQDRSISKLTSALSNDDLAHLNSTSSPADHPSLEALHSVSSESSSSLTPHPGRGEGGEIVSGGLVHHPIPPKRRFCFGVPLLWSFFLISVPNFPLLFGDLTSPHLTSPGLT